MGNNINIYSSILTSIKKLLGITQECTDFDPDIIMHINTVIMILNQLGVGEEGFQIYDDSSKWEDFIDLENFAAVKSYIHLKVKLMFDPPLNSAIIESIKESIRELEWRLNINAEESNQDRSNAYSKITKIKKYLYDVTYDNLDYNYANQYFKRTKLDINNIGCTSIRKGLYHGRNLDWLYDNNAEFIVRVPKNGTKYSSIGIAGLLDQLTDEIVSKGKYNEAYKILPFRMLDGINEKGVVVNINVVPSDKGITTKTIPCKEERDEICILMLIRYILDNFKTAKEAVEYIRDYVSIYNIKQMSDTNYECHFMISDLNETYIIEFIENIVHIIDATQNPYMTNFYLSGVELNSDGSVYSPSTSDNEHNAKITNNVTDNGCGLERYNYIVSKYSDIQDKEDIISLLQDLKYTNSYNGGLLETGEWYTEFVGINNLTVESAPELFEETIDAAKNLYNNRSRNKDSEIGYGTWQTTHMSVYDIQNKNLVLIVQEDNKEIDLSLS